MHVAKNGGNHQLAFRKPLLFLQVVLEVGNGFFHNFRRLQYKGQDQITCAETIANFLHRGQQDLVEDGHRDSTFGLFSMLGKNGIDIRFDVSFVPA